jgi:ABC-type transport system involved in Fe-S cluster assembly fused permease/ATPase subunit
VTDWRNALRTHGGSRHAPIAHAVDSLLNYETVKYFGAEKREEATATATAPPLCRAAVKSENSLAWLNIGQS